MSTFGPDPKHRFAFGLRTIGRTPPAASATEPFEPWEFVYRLGDIGAWGVGFADDDLFPPGSSPSERHDVVDKVAKALDSTGMVVSIAAANVSSDPVFARGAFTSADRDVRRYAIQKAMRALDLGGELGAELHELSGESESIAAKSPLDVLERFREAVDFLCAYACEQGYAARFAVRDSPHALAFIGTLDRPELVGLGPVIVHGDSAWCHGIAQVIEAGKLFHLRLDAQPAGHDFLLVKLLEDAGYDGPLHFDLDPRCVDDAAEMWDVTAGCMRTYLALAAKARRFADDPDIRDAVAACGLLELAEPSVGTFSADAGQALSRERFDVLELVQRQHSEQRLDQLVNDLVLGLR
jgi:xylose isomerase